MVKLERPATLSQKKTPMTMLKIFFNSSCFMKKTFRFFAFAAVAVAMLFSCAKETAVSNEEDTGRTFTVTAEYTEPNTDVKTAFVDGDSPYVKWLSDDKIRVYEFIDGSQNAYFSTADNGTRLSDDGKTATFDVSLYGQDRQGATAYCYTAVYPANGVVKSSDFYYFEIPASQTLVDGNFAANADILIGKPVNMDSRITTTTNLEVQFKRPGTVVALTLKGITSGETISSVKITAPEGQKIAGRSKVNLLTGEISDKAYYGGTNVITLNCGDAVATGTDVFYFRCLDGTWASGSEVSITVETDAATYSKTVNLPKDYVFADGGLTRFGFQGMTREEKASMPSFEKHSGNLVEGDYIICSGNTAMKNGISSSRSTYETVEVINDVVKTNSTEIVWHIAQSGDYWTIYNASAKKYAASNGEKNQLQLLGSDTEGKSLWTVSCSGSYEFVNKYNKEKNVNANLRYNPNYGFACYGTSTGSALTLYLDPTSVKEKVATPALAEGSAVAGEVAVGTVIKLTCATEGATIHYTVDGTEPAATSTEYADAGITINDDCTIKAIAIKEGCTDSNVLTLEYTVQVAATPEISVSDAGLATVSCVTEGASIHYTLDAEPADPTDESTLYKEPVQMTSGQTIKAIAYKAGYKTSAVAEATFISGSYDVTFTHSQEHGTVTVNGDETGSVKVAKDGDVTIVATAASHYHFVSWTITPEVTFTSGSETDATATFTMPESAVTVSATFEKDPAATPVVLFDFSKIDGFSDWNTSYSKREVVYTNAIVTFTSANRQTGTITDVPVTKGSDITVLMKDNAVINELILVTKQWPSKNNTVTLNTSTDGGTTYTATSFTASAGSNLNATGLDGVNAIKFTFSSSNDQIGIAALSINGAELPKEDASWSVGSVSVKVDEDKEATISTNYDGTLSVTSGDETVATASISGKTITVRGVAEGSTTLTVTGPATQSYNAISKTIDVTVTAGGGGDEPEYAEYTIIFKKASSDGSKEIKNNTAVSNVVESGAEYITGFTNNCSKAYYSGKSGVKLGSSSAVGTLEFNLSDTAKSKVKSIKVVSAKYGYDTGKLSLYNGSTSLETEKTPGEDFTHEFTSPATVGSIKLTTSSKRAYITSITIKVQTD